MMKKIGIFKMNRLSSIVLSFLAAICFFIVYFLHRETVNLVLGCVWIVIAIGNYTNYKKKGK